MKIHEYQAKRLLRDFDIPTPIGEIATTASDARKAAESLPSGRYVVKAQIHAGGRGKGGGIKVAENLDEVEKYAAEMLGMQLVTPQTGPEGKEVQTVLIESGINIANELYLGIVIDRETTRTVVMASTEGGMEIEEVARDKPEAIVKEAVDPLLGLRPYQARRLASRLNLDDEVIRPMSNLITNLVRLFNGLDASLIEINPLVITDENAVLALDCKLNFDGNALFRHPDIAELRDTSEEDPLEVEASKYDLNYIKLDGDIGCMVNGAGLAMATMDIIQLVGSSPANFLDVGGGANVERIANAFRILTTDASVKGVLVNIFGGIVRCDRVAEGIISALKTVDVDIPIVIRLEGTNAIEAREILARSDRDFVVATTLADAAQKVVDALPSQA